MTVYEHPLDSGLDAASDFRIWIDLDASPPRIAVAGDIDLATCASLRDALVQACERNAHSIELDFRRVTFIGSTGIREIARALAWTENIQIHAPSPAVRRVLEMVALGPRVTIIEQD